MAHYLKRFLTKSPELLSTAVGHYRDGPPCPSWDLKFHLFIKFITILLRDSVAISIEAMQKSSARPLWLTSDVLTKDIVISNEFRAEAQVYLEKLFEPYKQVLDDSWKAPANHGDGLECELVYPKNQEFFEEKNGHRFVLYLHGGGYYLGSAKSPRPLTAAIAPMAGAHVFSVEYRLAPQNQFPAALHDALAAYLYLLRDFKPERIVFMGDSAGGGLALSLVLAVRDAGLPLPAAVVGFSAWVDLTVSMPSVTTEACKNTDYIPGSIIVHKPSQVYHNFQKQANSLSDRIKSEKELSFPLDGELRKRTRFNLYAANEALAIPYVSPLLAESLGGLPPICLHAGNGERLRDESIYFGFKAADPKNHLQPAYIADKFHQSTFQTPTNVTLEVYDEMPHVWQIFGFHASAKNSLRRTAEFIRRATDPKGFESPPSADGSTITALCVGTDGVTRPLDREHLEVLKWDRVGKIPDFTSPFTTGTNQRPRSSFIYFASAMLLTFSVLAYVL